MLRCLSKTTQSASSRALFVLTSTPDSVLWVPVKIPPPGFISSSLCVPLSSDLGQWPMIRKEQALSNKNAYMGFLSPKFPQPPLLPPIKDKSLGKLVCVADCLFPERI